MKFDYLSNPRKGDIAIRYNVSTGKHELVTVAEDVEIHGQELIRVIVPVHAGDLAGGYFLGYCTRLDLFPVGYQLRYEPLLPTTTLDPIVDWKRT